MRAKTRSVSRWILSVLAFAGSAFTADTVSLPSIVSQPPPRPAYYWEETPVAEGAKLVTLFGRFGPDSGGTLTADVPLVAVLRDTLSDASRNSLTKQNSNDERLRYVWLLTSDRSTVAQHVLSAVPFFYWKVGRGESASSKAPGALTDLSRPTHRVWREARRNIFQWTAFDPMTTPVRASSRAYRTNSTNRERVQLEEAIALLRRAPASNDGSGLTSDQVDSVVARLMLAKNMMGGLMKDSQLERVGDSHDAQRQSTIGRNWELLRTSAERTGLIFEPLRLNGTEEGYGVLWFPLDTSFSAPGIALESTWKLLHISNPWRDNRLLNWDGYAQRRSLDKNGRLLPLGETGATEVKLAPLAVYSLAYPRSPLLVVDFRDRRRAKRREVIQRATDEMANGVFALSHFANWYYYAGNDMYQFMKSRRGAAVNANARLDRYAEFRVAAALDTSLDPTFREELQRRSDGLSVNPLEISVNHAIELARRNYQELLAEASDPEKLPKTLDKDRRQELASFGKSPASKIGAGALHYLSFTAYTRRAPQRDDNLARLSRQRKTDSLIQYLSRVAKAGPEPETVYNSEEIRQSIAELETLVDGSSPAQIRNQATVALKGVRAESKDSALRADCNRALIAFDSRNPIQLTPLASERTMASEIRIEAASALGTK